MAAAAIPAINPAGEPPTALRQNGDGTEAPSAPPVVQPIFESHSVSVPVDGSPGTCDDINFTKFSSFSIISQHFRRRS